MASLLLEVWSDIVCPWCYIGKRRLESALAAFPHRDQVEVAWRAFELDPEAKNTPLEGPFADRLARKYGVTRAEGQAMIDRVCAVAADEGLVFDFTRVQPANTFDAHRLLHFAQVHGKQDALNERLMRAHFCEGEAVGAPATLTRLAAEIGLDAAAARHALDTGAYAESVREQERRAADLGIRGVPFFVFSGRFAVSGAQAREVFARALDQAWAHGSAEGFSAGAACGPDGCA